MLSAATASAADDLVHCFLFTAVDKAPEADWQAFFKATDALPSKIPVVKHVWYSKLNRPMEVGGETRQFQVEVKVDSEDVYEEASAADGTTYYLSNTSVGTITADGLFASGNQTGKVYVTVIHGGLSARIFGPLAIVAGIATELIVRANYPGQLTWLPAVLIAVGALATLALVAFNTRRMRLIAVGAALTALLVAPSVWAFDTLGYATNGTFPAGGPKSVNAGGVGGIGNIGGGRRNNNDHCLL